MQSLQVSLFLYTLMSQAGEQIHLQLMIIDHLFHRRVLTYTFCVYVSPVVLSVTDSVLEGNFVLATLSEDANLRKNSTKR